MILKPGFKTNLNYIINKVLKIILDFLLSLLQYFPLCLRKRLTLDSSTLKTNKTEFIDVVQQKSGFLSFSLIDMTFELRHDLAVFVWIDKCAYIR